eukprot:m.439107 g.439107  ORF g.439107 m.439107 type:complete len:152 (+) comp18333_c0_seq1:36-491(+)
MTNFVSTKSGLLFALALVCSTGSITARPSQSLLAPATPTGKVYCCGVGSGPDCGGPDWTPLNFTFGALAPTVNVAITIDSAASKCVAESYKLAGTAITFPNLPSKTDCLGNVLRGTGALDSDLVVTYDPTADTVTVEVDSEGVTATLQVCK